MLGAELRYFQSEIGSVDDFLQDSVDLVAEHERSGGVGIKPQVLKRHRMFGLLHTYYYIALLMQTAHEGKSVIGMLPRDAVLRSESRLVDFRRGRAGTDAAEVHLVGPEGVGRPESAADIMCAAYVVEHQNGAGRRERGIFGRFRPPEFDIQKFPVLHEGQR